MIQILTTILVSLATLGVLNFSSFQNEPTVGLAILKGSQGGTGIGSAVAGDVGKVLKVLDDSPFTWELGTDNSGGGGGSFPFSSDTNYAQVVYSTSTPTLWFKSGLFASSTSFFTSLQSLFATTTTFRTETLLATASSTIHASTTITGVLTASGGIFGNLTGTASLATALAANGSNCSAGSAPLGVDTLGAVESCFDVWTEAENTSAAYFNGLDDFTGTLTDGKICTYDLAGGEIDCDYTDQTGAAASAFEVATTTDIAVSQLAYVNKTSGRTTLASVATGTISVPTGLTGTANRYVVGGNFALGLDTGYVIPLQSTLDAKALGATTLTVAGTANQITSSAGAQDLSANRTWTLSLPNLVVFPSNASSTLFSTGYASSTLWYGGGLLSTCAAGSFLTWTTGVFGCDTDDNTTYTAGDGLTLTATDFDFDGGDTPQGELGGTWASPTLDDSVSVATWTLAGATFTGNIDAGGATFFEIPNGTGNTADDPGEIAHDTSDNQLILDDFVVGRATSRIWGVTVASTSPYMIGGTNLAVPDQADGYTMTSITCRTVSGTSVAIVVTDGTNPTESITCDSDGAADDGSIANATFTAGEDAYIDFGTVTGAVDTVSISVFGQYTRE